MTGTVARWGVGSAAVFGAWLRFGALGREGLWLDELFTVRVATRDTWAQTFADLAIDVHPLGYFSLARLLATAEMSEAAWRMPSAAAGVATILGAALLAHRLLGAWAGVLAAWLVATAPGLVLLDREARPNALLAALGIWLCALVLTGRRGWWLAPLVAALVHVHVFGLFVLAAALGVGLLDPVGRRPLLFGAGLGALTLIPWLGTLRAQISSFVAASWYIQPSADSLGWVLFELHDSRAGLVVLSIVGLGLALARREPAVERIVMLAVGMSVATVVVPQLISYELAPILRPRSAVVLVPLFAIVSAAGLSGFGRSGAAVATLLVVAQAMVSWRVTRHEVRMEQWKEAASLVRAQATQDEVVIANHPHLWRYYLRSRDWIFDAAEPGLHAAPSAWVLYGHDLDDTPALAALLDGAPIQAETELRSVRVVHTGPVSVPLSFVATPDTPASVDGPRVEMWANGTVESGPLRVRGRCAVEVEGSEDPAGAEHAILRVKITQADAVMLDEPLALTPTVLATRTAATADPLFGEVEGPVVRVRLSFVNDAVVAGQDRNVHVLSVRLRCV